jgi:hypothetical protein
LLGDGAQTEQLGFLLFSNEGAPARGGSSAFWQMEYNDWAALRSLVLLEATNVGGISRPAACQQQCSVCPSIEFPKQWPECTIKHHEATGCSPALVVRYAEATAQGNALVGTFCNADTWMGDVHDKAVLLQQLLDEKRKAPPELSALLESAQQINAFFQAIDLGKQIDLVMTGLCFRPG